MAINPKLIRSSGNTWTQLFGWITAFFIRLSKSSFARLNAQHQNRKSGQVQEIENPFGVIFVFRIRHPVDATKLLENQA